MLPDQYKNIYFWWLRSSDFGEQLIILSKVVARITKTTIISAYRDQIKVLNKKLTDC